MSSSMNGMVGKRKDEVGLGCISQLADCCEWRWFCGSTQWVYLGRDLKGHCSVKNRGKGVLYVHIPILYVLYTPWATDWFVRGRGSE